VNLSLWRGAFETYGLMGFTAFEFKAVASNQSKRVPSYFYIIHLGSCLLQKGSLSSPAGTYLCLRT